MIDDPRDRTAYRMAITMLGLALIVTIIGVCWVAAVHDGPKSIPTEIWLLPAGFGGVFVGLLIPFATHKRKDPGTPESTLVFAVEAILAAGFLAVAAVAAGAVGATVGHLFALCGVGTALGGVFFGLFIPSPGRRDP
jgi:4-amino-4-deoxy-L-arabinose transferase-like glycosyltransferase